MHLPGESPGYFQNRQEPFHPSLVAPFANVQHHTQRLTFLCTQFCPLSPLHPAPARAVPDVRHRR